MVNLHDTFDGQKKKTSTLEEWPRLAKTETQESTIKGVQKNKYLREIKPNVWVDVYDVLWSFYVTCPATQHAIKKLLASGKRGYKDQIQDLEEAKQSIERAIQIATKV